MKILIGTLVEMMLDTVDLINLFLDNHCLHLVYALLKLISVGLWTLAQADLRITPLWFIPIGIAIVITMILQEWFEEFRKWALVLLSVISTLAWSIILLVRCIQTSYHLEQAEKHIESNSKSKEKYKKFIETLVGKILNIVGN